MTAATANSACSPSSLAPAPLDDLPTAVALIAEVTGASIAEVKQRLLQEHRWLGCNVLDAMRRGNVTPYTFGEAMARFYAQTDAFLYETFTWNRYTFKRQMRRWILAFLEQRYASSARILAFGDGLGFDSAALALAGHQVTYFEVGQRNIAFAQRVFAANSVEVAVRTSLDGLAAESFDVVVCLDVLEHVPTPPQLVEQLATYVRPSGHLISHAPFWFVHCSVGTHLAGNQKYSGDLRNLYGREGLRAVDGAIVWNPIVLEKVNGPGTAKPIILLRSQAKLYLGGMLLKFARWWKWPLVTIFRALSVMERRRLLARSRYLEEP